MTVAGAAAMLLWYDIVPEQVAEHDEWHTREHFPERVAIPGFLRAQRWVAQGATSPRYFVSYEVRDTGVLTSAAYRERLDHPSEWTRRIMPHFRGMARGFCALDARIGDVQGAEVLTVRCAPASGRREALAERLRRDTLPAISRLRGFANALVYVATVKPPMTVEQGLRGRDAEVDTVVIVTGHHAPMIEAARTGLLSGETLARQGGAGCVHGHYRLACRADAPPPAGPGR
ncbi:MAG: hypothetical protein U1F41_10305 [Burkholderiales bacterium]